MRCPRCQHENREGRRFCATCGAALAMTCASCGFSNEPGENFCGGCGQPLLAPQQAAARFPSPQAYTPKHLAEKILTSKSALEGERKQVTVLFCDLANSTALAERLGPEAMHGLLNRFFELALAEVHRYEGTINQFLGDGFMALFGAPIAHEDHARRAVLAALGIQRALRERRGELGPPDGELAIRMGLNTGPVVVGKIGDNLRMDYTAVGDTTHLAARLQQLADPGTILVSDATSRLVTGYVRLETLAPVQVKGKAESIQAFSVTGLGPRRSPLEGIEERALSRFVGRARELATLHELLAQAETGQGQVVGIVGEPGVGKSRLLLEFRRSLAGRRLTYLEGRCLSFGSAIPYLPVLDQFKQNCGIAETDSNQAIADKVRAALQEVKMDPDEWAAYLLRLLGVKEGTEQLEVLTPEAIKARTFEAFRQLSLRGSRRRPIIFAVEDLHWIDKTSEEYFSSLVESLAGAPILLLSTYRPGYRPPWMEKSYATQMSLHRLSPHDSLTVVHSVLQTEQLADSLAQGILSKAEGNPFFLEELARAVREHEDLTIPDTIQGVLMARIDRLPDEAKRVLQTASVLGREVPLGLLAAIWEGPGSLAPHLAELKRQEFLYEQMGPEEPAYAFKHVLTQEVAYESLLTPHRQALHAAAGRALERLHADRLEAVYDRLAYHYSKTDDTLKALEYLTHFAEKAARIDAHAEAVTALEEAGAQAERLPTEERDRRLLEVVLRQAESLYFLGRHREIMDLLLQHQDRLERLHEPSLNSRFYLRLGMAHSFLGNRQQAAQCQQRALQDATRCGDVTTMGRVHRMLTPEGWFSGQLDEAVAHGRQAVSLLERTDDRFWLGDANYALSLAYYWVGDFERAIEAAARADAIGQTIGSRRLQTYGARIIGLSRATRGEWHTGIEACQRALQLSPDPFETALDLACLGKAYLEKGDVPQAVPLLEQAVQQADQLRSRQMRAWFRTMLGEAYLSNGQIDAARTVALKGLEISTDVKFLLGVGLSQRALGRIAQAAGTIVEATGHLTGALQSFGLIHARFEQGCAHLDLAVLAHALGNRQDVATHLTEAHSLFTTLRVPKYVDRTEQLAREFGVRLPEDPAR